MGALQHFIEALYDRLLLRDIFGKIVPGSLFLFSLILLISPNVNIITLPKIFPFSSLVLIYGVSWIFGFAIQSFGEMTKMIRYSPKGTSFVESIEIRNKFNECATDMQRQQAERYTVIKDSCAYCFRKKIE